MRGQKARGVALGGMLFALAILLSFVEGMVAPALGLPPGVKPGLANIVVMYALFFLGRGQALTLVLLKSFFAMLTRGPSAGALSLAGGLLSLCALLLLLLPREKPSYFVLSVAGAVSHNLGQLLMASLWLKTAFSLAYAPVLIVSGVGMGAVTAVSLRLLLPALGRSEEKKNAAAAAFFCRGADGHVSFIRRQAAWLEIF